MKKFFYIPALLLICSHAVSQQFMTVVPDSASLIASPGDFIGFSLFATDNSVTTLNQTLHFRYVSQSNGYVMSHDMNLQGLGNIPNIGIGMEETAGNHLLINFMNATIGYIHNTLDFSFAAGVGYSLPVNAKKNLVLRAFLNIYYENISYGLGSYSDSTLIGFEVNGSDIGTYIKNVKYVNNIIGFNPGLEIVYRGKKFDFLINAGYSHALFYKEKIDFYRTSIPISEGLYNTDGSPANKGLILPGNYIIQLGIIKEFSL